MTFSTNDEEICQVTADTIRDDAYYGDLICEWADANGIVIDEDLVFPDDVNKVPAPVREAFEATNAFRQTVAEWGRGE